MVTKEQVFEWVKAGKEIVYFINKEGQYEVCLSEGASTHCFDENNTVEFTKQEFDSLG